jgi:tetratricopeptide (TPR) repeat protein
MRTVTASTLALALLLSISVARADDEPKPDSPEAKTKAGELMKEAEAHAKDEDPTKAKDAAEKALKLSPNDVIIMRFLAWINEIKVGDEAEALKYYDMAVRSLAGASSPKHLRFKADMMARKANLIYSFKDDLNGAIEFYQLSWETAQLSETAFRLSNLLHLRAGLQTDPARKSEWNQKALKAAQDAYTLMPTSGYQGDQARAYAAKVRTQMAICFEVTEEKEKAQKILEGVSSRDFDDSCLYNQALLEAVRGKSEEATAHLKKFMLTRPTPRARNRLRKFIRNDPDFRELIKRPDWKELVEDEKVDEKKSG